MGHKYLTEQVQATIRTEAARALAFIDSIEPPISLKDLYLNDNLVTSTFKPDDPDYLELAERIGADAKSLRGCLFVPDRHVIARDDGYKQRTNFVLAHEFGHWKLPWHQALLYQCTQFDLSTKASAQLEKEANFLLVNYVLWVIILLSVFMTVKFRSNRLQSWLINFKCRRKQHFEDLLNLNSALV